MKRGLLYKATDLLTKASRNQNRPINFLIWRNTWRIWLITRKWDAMQIWQFLFGKASC